MWDVMKLPCADIHWDVTYGISNISYVSFLPFAYLLCMDI